MAPLRHGVVTPNCNKTSWDYWFVAQELKFKEFPSHHYGDCDHTIGQHFWVTQDVPQVTQNDPQVTQDDPWVTQDNPWVTQDNAGVTQDDSCVSQNKPSGTYNDPWDGFLVQIQVAGQQYILLQGT